MSTRISSAGAAGQKLATHSTTAASNDADFLFSVNRECRLFGLRDDGGMCRDLTGTLILSSAPGIGIKR